MFRKIIVFAIISLVCFASEAQPDKLNSFIDDYAKKNNFNGTILVQNGNQILFHNSFGIADRRFNVPINNNTIYKTASITKAFTSVLILQLKDNGKLDMNKTVDVYLPDYKGEAGSKVTIHQLLNHTSGMRQIDTISSLQNAFKYGLGYLQKPHTSDELLSLFEKDSLVNVPGKHWDYNNFEYMVLGKIIEKIYGKPYEEVLNEKILFPLKMKHTGVLHTNNIIENLASTYFTADNSQELIPDLPVYMENWYASGSLYSCTDDLIKFSNALFSGQLITKVSLDLMLTPGLDDYGYGVWVRGEGDLKVMERFGSIMGANAVWTQFLNKNITVILLSNTNLIDLGEFALSIGEKVMEYE
ncbi:serine hydrolase domain-containing protein [Sinomicrobium sp. M5D2P9]